MREIRSAFIIVAVTAGLFVSGCSQVEDAVQGATDKATTEAAAAAIESAVEAALAESGVSLQAPPDCDPDLSVDGLSVDGTVTCAATTTDGKEVSATFNGTISTTECAGDLTVIVGGETLVDVQDIPACLLAG